jgi:hypothetical protein
MNIENLWKERLDEKAFALSKIELGLKLIATINPEGEPHITMISFTMGKTPNQIVWGQFTQGLSKKNVLKNPKQGIFIMNAGVPFKFIQAKVKFTHTKKGGEDCEYFSRQPLLRYMTYTNVHTAYYNDIISCTSVRNLGLFGIINGVLVNLIGKNGAKIRNPIKKLEDFGYNLFNGPFNPKYLSYIDSKDGYPIILPVFSIRAPDKSRLIFSVSQFSEELKELKVDSKVATFAVVAAGLELTNQMVNGTFTGYKKIRGITYGMIEIDKIYNSMLPLSGYIYPEIQKLEKVRNFNL